MTTTKPSVQTVITIAVSVLVGILLLATWRFVHIKNTAVHYHANFALYINGVRDEFKSPTFYEEVQTCGSDLNNPRARVHMHDQENSVVHVHDLGVTWSHFFGSLGYTLGDSVVATGSHVYVDGQDGNKLSFILNGEKVSQVANKVINDDDTLLISYGNESSADLQKQYASIPQTAHEHDITSDPATCSGSKKLTLSDKLKTAFGLN